jgi:hypothetical protein
MLNRLKPTLFTNRRRGLKPVLRRATLFASFSGKRRLSSPDKEEVFGGYAPKPPGSASPSFGLNVSFCYIFNRTFKASQSYTFLLFLEKEENPD